MELLEQISENLQKGQAKKVAEFTQQALDEGKTPKDILLNGLLAGMSIIGKKFKNNEVYVPEVLIAARAMHAGMNVLKPILSKSGVEPVGKVLLGTVKGDLHDIGKNLVRMMLEGAGFEVVDIGVDVPEATFVEKLKEVKPDILAMSALLTTTMPQMKVVIDAVKEAGLRDGLIIMVGGAPVTADFAKEIGADAYSKDAAEAAERAKELVTSRK